jgi:hypothetical protein
VDVEGTDGIAETTWPGVYNRSRLPGRNDYFQLPDWNVYVEGGKQLTLTLPDGETVNRIEIGRGADVRVARPHRRHRHVATAATKLLQRPHVVQQRGRHSRATGGVLTLHAMSRRKRPIQEIWAYQVSDGAEPTGRVKDELPDRRRRRCRTI